MGGKWNQQQPLQDLAMLLSCLRPETSSLPTCCRVLFRKAMTWREMSALAARVYTSLDKFAGWILHRSFYFFFCETSKKQCGNHSYIMCSLKVYWCYFVVPSESRDVFPILFIDWLYSRWNQFWCLRTGNVSPNFGDLTPRWLQTPIRDDNFGT